MRAGAHGCLARSLDCQGFWRRGVEFERCGVGFGGPVDFARQRVAISNVVVGWNGFPWASYLNDQLSVPTFIDNEANLGGLGKAVYGTGAGSNPLFYVTHSTGIGCGPITNGRDFHGADSFAGEIGHIPVRPDGPRCDATPMESP